MAIRGHGSDRRERRFRSLSDPSRLVRRDVRGYRDGYSRQQRDDDVHRRVLELVQRLQAVRQRRPHQPYRAEPQRRLSLDQLHPAELERRLRGGTGDPAAGRAPQCPGLFWQQAHALVLAPGHQGSGEPRPRIRLHQLLGRRPSDRCGPRRVLQPEAERLRRRYRSGRSVSVPGRRDHRRQRRPGGCGGCVQHQRARAGRSLRQRRLHAG